CTRITRWSRRASTSKGRYDQPSTPGTSRCRSSPTRAAYGLVITHLPAFLGVAALVIVAPGPDTALTIRNTLRGGRRSGVLTGVGVVGGQTVWAIATAAGVAALLHASEPAFLALKVVGAGYLAFLGIQALVAAFRGGKPALYGVNGA